MKTHTHKLILGAFIISGLLFSCKQQPKGDQELADTTAAETAAEKKEMKTEEAYAFEVEKNGIKLTAAPKSPEFPNAELELKSPDLSKNLKAGKTTFEFGVENYELGIQTEGKEHCANSAKGQHIHFILNNSPYSAHYETTVEKELTEGKHLLLSFLSRSYHESIKNGKAHILKQINVGNATGDDYDLSAPHLFYSRPKGTYKGDDTGHLLLDFFLINTELAEDGNKVKVTIDGTEFTLSKWVPYIVEGLEAGDHTFRIQLIDNEGNPVEGPFNDSGERTITLEAAG